MKKLFLALFLTTLSFTTCAFCDENVNLPSMPTDEEIMQVINQFNFDDSQKIQLFRETKNKLQEMYNNGTLQNIQGQDNILNNLQNSNSSLNSLETSSEYTNSSTKVKKYSNHSKLNPRTE